MGSNMRQTCYTYTTRLIAYGDLELPSQKLHVQQYNYHIAAEAHVLADTAYKYDSAEGLLVHLCLLCASQLQLSSWGSDQPGSHG